MFSIVAPALLTLAAFTGLSQVTLAQSMTNRDDRVEIPIEAALSPRVGFDDNDMIEVVLHGRLPNTCYRLEEATYQAQEDGTLRVRQFATVTQQGLCYDKSSMPPHYKMEAPFTNTLRIGRMRMGQYRIVYGKADGTIVTRELSVERAPVPGIDNLPYAPVTSVVARDYVNGSEEVIVTINGMLTSSCVELAPNTEVINQGDTFVVLPVIRPLLIDPAELCESTPRPFSIVLNLGKQDQGHHLIYVRSMAGNAVSKVFEVLR